MPSTFRSSRSGRQFDSSRTRTGQIDHDVFEGLPVRRWSRQPHTHSQAPKTEDSEFVLQGPGGTGRLPELAMPRDSQLLGAGSRALLRAARAGCIYIHQNTRASEKDDKEAGEGEDGTTGTHAADRSFTSRKWTTLPKQLEPADVEFLAKRRPGLPSLYGGVAAMDGSGAGPGPMRRTKFKKTDPTTGKISIYEAWVPEGHRIEGEISGDIQAIAGQSDVPVNSEIPAPGTVVEGVGVVNSEGVVIAEAGSASVMTPPKRRPPPPKRKGKGIGKGRKKKVMFAPGEGADAAEVHGVSLDMDGHSTGPKEGQEGSQMPMDQLGQEEDEDGEDGEDGEDSDEADESIMDAKTPDTPQAPDIVTVSVDHPTVSTTSESKDVEMTDATFDSQSSVPQSSSVNGNDGPPEPSKTPTIAEVTTSRSEVDHDVSSTPASITETIKFAGNTTEESSGLNKDSHVDGGPSVPQNESIQPESEPSAELAIGTVIQERPLPSNTLPSTASNDSEAVPPEPTKTAVESLASEEKAQNESTSENITVPASAGLEMCVEGAVSEPKQESVPETELTEEKTIHSDSNELKPAISTGPEADNNGETNLATLNTDTRVSGSKEGLQITDAFTLSGHGEETSQAQDDALDVNSHTNPNSSPSASTEPPSAIAIFEPSNVPATERITGGENLSSEPEPSKANLPNAEPSESASVQAPTTAVSESTTGEVTTNKTQSPSGPVSERE